MSKIISNINVLGIGPARKWVKDDDENTVQVLVDSETLKSFHTLASKKPNGIKSKNSHASEKVSDIIGRFFDFELRDDKVIAKLELSEKFEDYENLVWAFENLPSEIAFSPFCSVDYLLKDGFAVMRPNSGGIFSIDLVTEGATTPEGLFKKDEEKNKVIDTPKDMTPEEVQTLINEAITALENKLIEKIDAIKVPAEVDVAALKAEVVEQAKADAQELVKLSMGAAPQKTDKVKTVLEQYTELKSDTEKSAFIRKNESELRKLNK